MPSTRLVPHRYNVSASREVPVNLLAKTLCLKIARCSDDIDSRRLSNTSFMPLFGVPGIMTRFSFLRRADDLFPRAAAFAIPPQATRSLVLSGAASILRRARQASDGGTVWSVVCRYPGL